MQCIFCKTELNDISKIEPLISLHDSFTIRLIVYRCPECNQSKLCYYNSVGHLFREEKYKYFNRNGKRIKKQDIYMDCNCPNCIEKVLVHFPNLEEKSFVEKECPWCLFDLVFEFIKTSESEGQITTRIHERFQGPGSTAIKGITNLVIQKQLINNEWLYVARIGIAILGSVNFEQCINANPFDPDYHDNYIEGKGLTKEEAINNILSEQENLSKGLFA